MENLNYKQLCELAKTKGINPVGKTKQWLIDNIVEKKEEIKSYDDFKKAKKTTKPSKIATSTGPIVKFKTKKGEIVTGEHLRDYTYPKTNEVFLIVKVENKTRLVRRTQICS